MLVHPINLLISKMAFLYSCTYKTKLMQLGWQFDSSNYSQIVSDINQMSELENSAIEDA